MEFTRTVLADAGHIHGRMWAHRRVPVTLNVFCKISKSDINAMNQTCPALQFMEICAAAYDGYCQWYITQKTR